MRVFLAIEFPERIKEYLNQVQLFVKGLSIKGNFTRKENFHLTLQFIGEINNDEQDRLKEVIDQVALKQNSFQMTISKAGYFARGNKKIIWVGIQPNEMLNKLNSLLNMLLEYQGYPIERKSFVPHITIGREVVLKEEFYKIEQQIKMEKVIIPVINISLMESTRLKGELRFISLYTKEFR